MVEEDVVEHVRYEKHGAIAEITLDRQDRLNAKDRAMGRRLHQIWLDFEADDDLRVAILTGAGDRAFCAGADVKAWVETGGPQAGPRPGSTGFESVEKFSPGRVPVWKPVIVAVNGLCAGSALHFIHDGDIILAAEHATFFDPHLAVGQVSAGEPIGLSRRMPLGTVLAMVLLGKEYKLTAQRAYELGLVLEVLPGPDLMPRARELAAIIARQAPNATRLSKKAIYSSLNLGLADAYELGTYMLQANWGSPDQAEGPRAFAEKRGPQWEEGSGA